MRSGRSWIGATAAALVSLAGCPAGDDAQPDARPMDAGQPADANGAASGLVFAFEPRPAIPGELTGEVTGSLTRAVLELDDLRAIGDAAPGDDRTSLDQLVLAYEDGEPDVVVVSFPRAPPGLYSTLLGRVTSYSMVGSVWIDDTEYAFDIADELPTPVPFAVELQGAMLLAGQTLRVTIAIDFEDLLEEVPWEASEPNPDGVIVIRAGSEGAEAIGERLDEVMEAED